jgi:DNA-binding NarL/FixJ family response regulator
MVRARFRMLLSHEEDIEVVAEASNGHEGVDKAARFDQTTPSSQAPGRCD